MGKISGNVILRKEDILKIINKDDILNLIDKDGVLNIVNENDVVNKPKHYNRDNAMQCIDEMVLVFGHEKTAIFCLLNCWKYRYRSNSKGNAKIDMAKSDWYLNKYRELKELAEYEEYV